MSTGNLKEIVQSSNALLQVDILNSIKHCATFMNADVPYQHDRKRPWKSLRDEQGGRSKEEGVGRKKQVVQGRLKEWLGVYTNILFYTEHWPFLCVNLYGLSDNAIVWVYTKSEIPAALLTLFPSQVKWVSKVEASALSKAEACNWVLIQGTKTFVESALLQELSGRREAMSIIGVLPSQRIATTSVLKRSFKKWYRLRHSEIGGVSSSRWLVGLNYPTHNPQRALPGKDWTESLITYGLKRSFGDVLKCTIEGFPVPPPNKPLPTTVHLGSALEEQFTVSSFKSYSGWVRRKLGLMEIAGVFDLSELLIRKLEEENVSPHVWFNKEQPPLKISHAVKVLLFSIVRREQQGVAGEAAASDASSSSTRPVHGQSQPSDGLLQQISSIDKVDPDDVAAAYLQSYGDKAAKNDDARIPIELWDGHLFRHYFPSLSYSYMIHGRALKTLRKFMWRNMLLASTRSFAKFLVVQHGASWLGFYLSNRRACLRVASRKRKRGKDLVGDLVVRRKFEALHKDLKVGFEGLTRLAKSSWWEWDEGSTLLFWRWPIEIREAARDGLSLFIRKRLPRWIKRQRLPKEPHMAERMVSKFLKVQAKGYVGEGTVISMINCFAVPKGDDDIRLVYDGTKCGLNDSLWAPNFFLPSVDSMLLNMNTHTWSADLDLTEMFLNYPLNKDLVPYSGVDYTEVLQSKTTVWLRWHRMFMGLTSSPYVTGKMFGWTIDIIMGNRWDANNPFRWDAVKANLPGMLTYNPRQPRMVKTSEGNIAAALEAYVDDLRLLGHSELSCHAATARAAKILQYLGQQNATRKYRPPHVKPGPWCGSFSAVKNDSVWVYTSQEKWEKAKTFIRELNTVVAGSEGQGIDYKFLERGRGFMIYFCRTYTSFVPYLKGMHLTMDSWRKGRDGEGWKVKKDTMREEGEDEHAEEEISQMNLGIGNKEPMAPLLLKEIAQNPYQKGVYDHPDILYPVARLKDDISAFMLLLDQERAPWRFVRGTKVGSVQYGFGDAAQSGFGTTIGQKQEKMWYRLGVWGTDEASESSNYRELANLVQSLEMYNSTTGLQGTELFLFTDNATAEAAFYKGTSSSRKLFKLVLGLRQLEVIAGCLIHFVHVSGTRMIAQGTDGLSRGDLNEGVMKGDDILEFVPLHLSALERQPKLEGWIRSFVLPARLREEIIFLDYEGWFERAHDIVGGSKNADGVWIPEYREATYIWTPPPAAAQVAVEQLRRARLKREGSTHIMILPRLMTPEWRRQLFRVSDLCLELPFDNIWDKAGQHEPLTLAIVFPFLSHSPWQLKRSQAFLAMGNVLRRLWKEDQVTTGSILHKLFVIQRSLSDLSPGVVRKMLQGPGEFGLLHPSGTE